MKEFLHRSVLHKGKGFDSYFSTGNPGLSILEFPSGLSADIIVAYLTILLIVNWKGIPITAMNSSFCFIFVAGKKEISRHVA